MLDHCKNMKLYTHLFPLFVSHGAVPLLEKYMLCSGEIRWFNNNKMITVRDPLDLIYLTHYDSNMNYGCLVLS